MPNSFLVCSEDHFIPNIKITKFHINLWEINTKYVRLEVGLLFKISKIELNNHTELKFNLFTPFSIQKNSLSIVYQNLLNDSNISLIFNEKCINIKDCTTPSNLSYANLITLGNNESFLLVNADIIKNECDKEKIAFTITPKDIDLQSLDEDINFYVRFFYQVHLKKCNNIIKKFNLSTDFIIYDFRLRDLRLFESNNLKDKYDKIVSVESLYIFVINEIQFKPRLIDTKNYKYRRILEKELFKYYIKELNRTRKKYIIHFWKFDFKEGKDPANLKDTANLVVSFEKEKNTRVLSTFALVMNIIVALIFCFSNNTFEIKNFNPLILIIIVILILLLVLPNGIRILYNKFRISKVNKKDNIR